MPQTGMISWEHRWGFWAEQCWDTRDPWGAASGGVPQPDLSPSRWGARTWLPFRADTRVLLPAHPGTSRLFSLHFNVSEQSLQSAFPHFLFDIVGNTVPTLSMSIPLMTECLCGGISYTILHFEGLFLLQYFLFGCTSFPALPFLLEVQLIMFTWEASAFSKSFVSRQAEHTGNYQVECWLLLWIDIIFHPDFQPANKGTCGYLPRCYSPSFPFL